MKYIIITLFLVLSAISVKAQDHIITKTGKDILVNILEIREADVTYTLYTDSAKTPYVMDKEEIQKVVYENGIEERFTSSNNETIIRNNSTNRNTEPDKIYTSDGKVVYCEVVEKKRFGVNYIPVNSKDNYVEYLANTKIDHIEYANGEVEYISGSPNNNKTKKDPKDFSYLSPHFISVNIGPSIPLSLLSGPGSSTATTGFNANLEGSYYFFRGMGVSLNVGYIYNPYNGPSSFSASGGGVITDINYKFDPWQNIFFMGGIGYYNEYKRFFLDYKAMFGGFYTIYPTERGSFVRDGESYDYTVTANSISYLFGGKLGGRYYLTRKLQLKFDVMALFGRAAFDGKVQREFKNGSPSNGDGVVVQGATFVNQSWLNFSVGIAYTLGK